MANPRPRDGMRRRHMALWLAEAEWRKLEALAFDERRTVTDQVAQLVAEALADDEQPSAPVAAPPPWFTGLSSAKLN